MLYELKVEGHVSAYWFTEFENLEISYQKGGQTLIRIHLADQAALYSLLNRLSDLNLQLLEVINLEAGERDRSDAANPQDNN